MQADLLGFVMVGPRQILPRLFSRHSNYTSIYNHVISVMLEDILFKVVHDGIMAWKRFPNYCFLGAGY